MDARQKRTVCITIGLICVFTVAGSLLLNWQKKKLPDPKIITSSKPLFSEEAGAVYAEATKEADDVEETAQSSGTKLNTDPPKEENAATSAAMETGTGSELTEKININTATAEELDRLEGIGPVLSKRIVEYRAQTPFKTIYDIKKVSGIGDKKFEKIKDQITVGGE